MKKCLHFFVFACTTLLSIPSLSGQSTISYTYDAAGNRTKRTLTMKKTSFAPGTSVTASTQKDTLTGPKETVFEEGPGGQTIRISPNPTQEELRVEISGFDTHAGSGLYLYNLSGTLIQSKSPATSSDLLDLSACPNGTYLLKIVLGNRKSEWKIIKNN